MKEILLIAAALYYSAANPIPRPPALQPNDIPFSYDVTQAGEVLGYVQQTPGVMRFSNITVTEADAGEVPTIVCDHTADPNFWINPVYTSSPDSGDPDGEAVKYTWTWQYKTNTPRVTYLKFTTTDPLGASDERTILFSTLPVNTPPVITEWDN